MQDQHQRGVGAMRAMPVEVKKVTILKPQALALASNVGGFTPQRSPQCLQVRVAKAEGGAEAF